MDEVPPAEIGSENRDTLQMMGLFDAPAYIRRARGMEEAYALLLARCREVRGEMLSMPRLRLGTLHALAGGWGALAPLLSADDIDALARAHAELAPVLKLPPAPTGSIWRLRAALDEVIASNTRFNQRWMKYMAGVDLSEVNRLRDGYNRHYVVEKACALRSDLLARHGFEPMPPLTLDDLLALMPPLPVPAMKPPGA